MRISDWSSDVCSADLFARGVDADAAPAEQGQAAIGLDRAPVSGNRIADTADGLESSRRFFRILVIFERDRSLERDEPRCAAARKHQLVVLVAHVAHAADAELGGFRSPRSRRHRAAETQTFGSPEAVHPVPLRTVPDQRSEEHTSELQSLLRISYAA